MAHKAEVKTSLFVLLDNVDGKLEFYRGNPDGKRWNSGKRRNIRVFPTIGLAEAAKKANEAPDTVQIVEFVPKDVNLRQRAYDWSWEELENHISIFDHFDVTFSDGIPHPMFSGDSGVTVLRVTDVSPMKQVGDKIYLHISTDANFFGAGRHRVMSDEYITKLIEDTVSEMDFTGLTPTSDAVEALKKAFRIGVPPSGQPYIRSTDEVE